MTNAEKYEEVFGVTPMNSSGIRPCPVIYILDYSCPDTSCGKCEKWWDEEYQKPGKEN
jgi:hypothetical protein